MKNKLFLLYIIFSFIFINIGYAAINSITGEINGLVSATPIEDVFISDVYLKENINASYNINSYNKTLLNSNVTLLDSNSSITFTINIYNNTNLDYSFNDALFDSSWYDNNNIKFSLIGLKKNDILKSKNSIKFDIKFEFKDKTKINNKVLNSIINFNFKQMHKVDYINFINVLESYPKSAIDNDKLVINFISSVSSFDIKMNGILLNKNDYTFNNHILTIKNVTGNIEIINTNWFTPIIYDKNYIIDNSTKLNKITKDEWNNNIYNVYFDVNEPKNQQNNYNYQINIKNTSNFSWSSGLIYNRDIFGRNKELKIKGKLSSSNINPGETLIINFDTIYKINSNNPTYGRMRLSFIVNGSIKVIDFNLNFKPI